MTELTVGRINFGTQPTGTICPLCGQDHSKAMKCLGRKGGQHAKDPEMQRAKANKRWDKYYLENPDKVKNSKGG